MAIKICLDAGHYGKYNRSAAVPAYYESEMNWKLHLKLKAALEAYGFEVITTRPDQAKDLGTINRGNASKGCDLFLSIHSNAVGNYVKESVDYPLVIIQLDREGETLGKALGKAIQVTMGTTQPYDMWTKKNLLGQEAYGVLRGAAAVGTMGMILEHSFHTQTRATKWLMDDANLDKLAKVEAEVIADYYGVSKPVMPEKPSNDVAHAAPEAASGGIQEGDIVEIKAGAVYYTGKKIPNWVVAKQWIVKSVKGDRVVIDKAADGTNAICSPVNEKYLTVVKTVASVPKKTVQQLAEEVINGDWGNGVARKEKLTAAGYDYATVQKEVNRILKG